MKRKITSKLYEWKNMSDGRMYAGGGEFTENIDNVGGTGTAEFASKAIDIFYMSKK